MSDRARLLGRVGGTAGLPDYAMRVKDGHGVPEPERVEAEVEERFTEEARPLSALLRERRQAETALAIARGTLRKAIGKGKRQSTMAAARELKRQKKRLDQLRGEIGRAESGRRAA